MKYWIGRAILLALNMVIIGDYLGAPAWFAYSAAFLIAWQVLPAGMEDE